MLRAFAVLACLAAPLAACGSSDTAAPGAGGDGESGGDRVSAVAAVYPLAWMAEQVAPDAEVDLLNAGGLEAHDLEMTPSQRQAVETADVVLYVGRIDYQPQVEAASESSQGEVVSLAEVAGSDRLLEPVEDVHAEDADEHADQDEAVVDPHIWFDPEVMADAALRTGEAFAASDPERAQAYRQNAEALSVELTDLGDEFESTLGGECRHSEVVVSHQA